MNGIFKLDKAGISTTASRTAFDDEAKDKYVTPDVPVGGVVQNSTDWIWGDMYGGNLNFTTATNSGMGQYNPTRPAFRIGTPSLIVPTANMWIEAELEGTNTSCSRTISTSQYTRIESGKYQGWWKDASGNWHAMTNDIRNGSAIPGVSSLTGGLRGCYDQYFVDQRRQVVGSINSTIVKPARETASGKWYPQTHLYFKPINYHRWHGFGGVTRYSTTTSCKAIFFQIYARLVVDPWDNPNNIDDRHKAKYVIHTGSDRKGYDGTQMWDMGISRFKGVTNDWQPFNFLAGILSKAELDANPPPFNSNPL